MGNLSALRAVIARFVACVLIVLVRGLTAVRAEWHAGVGHRVRIYFGNHASHADFLLVWALLPPSIRPRARPVAAADYWLRGSIRRYLAASVFRSVLIDRCRAEDSPDPIDTMARTLDAGDSLILFPEGTRNTTESKLLPFKSGLFRLARARPRVECVPVWIENLNRVLPKGELVPVPLLCSVRFGRPIVLRQGESQSRFLERAHATLIALSSRRVEDVRAET